MTTITLDHVSKRFDQWSGDSSVTVTAIDDVSLRIASGQIMAIVGPSGCGKSTLLRLVAGLIAPDGGQIFYDHTDLRDIPPHERGIGMVFQNGALIPHWEARRNIGFFLWLRKREHEVPERIARISQITGIGLEELLDRRPGQLSGGEQQRVGVARALARDPRVFLFDEPFSNLDAKLRTQARIELKRLLHEFPVTSLYVTHDQIEAVSLADRTAIMRAGRIEQVGTFQHLYNNPVNLFVATFIGTPTINTFSGYIRDHHWYGVNFGGYGVRHDLDDGERVILGARAESVRLAAEGVPGIVQAVTPHFAERQQLLEVEAHGESWQVLAPLEDAIRVGQTVRCRLHEPDLLFFDAVTELRLG